MLDVRWAADQATQPFALTALEFSPSTGIPGIFRTVGTVSVDGVTGNAVLTEKNIALSNLVTASASGTFNVPAGYTQLRHSLVVRGRDGGTFSFTKQASSTEFVVAVPVSALLGDLEVVGEAAAPTGVTAFGSEVVRAGEKANITYPAAPVLATPPDAAVGVTAATEFSWTGGASDCIYQVSLYSSDEGSVQHVIWTAANTVTLPDLGVAALAPASTYRWSATCHRQRAAATIDEEVTAGGAKHTGSVATPEAQFSTQ